MGCVVMPGTTAVTCRTSPSQEVSDHPSSLTALSTASLVPPRFFHVGAQLSVASGCMVRRCLRPPLAATCGMRSWMSGSRLSLSMSVTPSSPPSPGLASPSQKKKTLLGGRPAKVSSWCGSTVNMGGSSLEWNTKDALPSLGRGDVPAYFCAKSKPMASTKSWKSSGVVSGRPRSSTAPTSWSRSSSSARHSLATSAPAPAPASTGATTSGNIGFGGATKSASKSLLLIMPGRNSRSLRTTGSVATAPVRLTVTLAGGAWSLVQTSRRCGMSSPYAPSSPSAGFTRWNSLRSPATRASRSGSSLR
mmetsp:Transcript_65414/g.181493  ORF Transcript_65414/g.181493 Transcript_65414/m.181493 type:complete len:305 (-) Transcript_65414:750-1664(-)